MPALYKRLVHSWYCKIKYILVYRVWYIMAISIYERERE